MTTDTENESPEVADTAPTPRRTRVRGRARAAASTSAARAPEPAPPQPPRYLLAQAQSALTHPAPTRPQDAQQQPDPARPALTQAPAPGSPTADAAAPNAAAGSGATDSTQSATAAAEPVVATETALAVDAFQLPPGRPAPSRTPAARTKYSNSPVSRARTITVPTAGLGAVTVRRLSLGAIASAAAHYRAAGEAGDVALVDALIAEASQPVNRAAGVRRRRLEDSELQQLSDEDRDALATALLALEGVATADDGVPEVPRLMLARRYTRIIGTGERIDRSVRAAVKPIAEHADRLEPTLSHGTVESIAGELAGSAALREVLEEDDWPQRLREHPDFAIDVQELLVPPARAEPSMTDPGQLPLFDGSAAAADAAATEASRAAPRTLDRLAARVDDIADSQRQLLQWHAQTKQAVAGGITDLALRAQERDGAERRLVRAALAIAAAFAVALVALAGWTFSLRGDLAATRAELTRSEQRHEAQIEELRKPAAQGAAARAPVKPATAPRKPPARN